MRISDWSSDVCSSDLLPGGVSVAAQIDGERQRNGGADGMRVVIALERLFEVAVIRLRRIIARSQKHQRSSANEHISAGIHRAFLRLLRNAPGNLPEPELK